MTNPDPAGSGAVVPGHRDTARALCAVLATFRGEGDVLDVLAAECASAGAVDRFVLALLSSFASFVACKVENPEQYLLSWVALTLELADAEEAGGNESGTEFRNR